MRRPPPAQAPRSRLTTFNDIATVRPPVPTDNDILDAMVGALSSCLVLPMSNDYLFQAMPALGGQCALRITSDSRCCAATCRRRTSCR